MSIIVFQHGPDVGPGRLGLTLRDHGLALDIRRLDLSGERPVGPGAVPPDFDGVDGVVSLGGEQNVGEPHPWMDAECDFLRRAHQRQLPVLGICLGSQLLAHALGGRVTKMPAPEWGFHTISINPTGQTDPILSGIAWDAPHFCAHEYEVAELPRDAVVLASSRLCRVQAWRAGVRTYAVQFHPECDRATIERWAQASEAARRAGLTPADVGGQCDAHYATFARLADRLCVNLASYLFRPVACRA